MTRRFLFSTFVITLATVVFPVISLAQLSNSNCVITAVGNPSASPTLPAGCNTSGGGPAGPCQTAPPASSDPIGEIKQKWNIALQGMNSEQVEAIRQEFYEVDCIGLLQDISGTTVTSNGVQNGVSQQIACPREGGTSVSFAVYSGTFTKAIILHELTHVWQRCSTRGEANDALIPNAYYGEGGVSKYSRNECTNIPVGDNWQNEDHADTIALYYNQWSGELTCGDGAPNPFAGGGHTLHADVAQKAKI